MRTQPKHEYWGRLAWYVTRMCSTLVFITFHYALVIPFLQIGLSEFAMSLAPWRWVNYLKFMLLLVGAHLEHTYTPGKATEPWYQAWRWSTPFAQGVRAIIILTAMFDLIPLTASVEETFIAQQMFVTWLAKVILPGFLLLLVSAYLALRLSLIVDTYSTRPYQWLLFGVWVFLLGATLAWGYALFKGTFGDIVAKRPTGIIGYYVRAASEGRNLFRGKPVSCSPSDMDCCLFFYLQLMLLCDAIRALWAWFWLIYRVDTIAIFPEFARPLFDEGFARLQIVLTYCGALMPVFFYTGLRLLIDYVWKDAFVVAR